MSDVVPVPMVLHCPECGTRHVDAGEFATKSHHTHSCQSCGLTWRPAVVPTVGVQYLPGFKDEPKSGGDTSGTTDTERLNWLEALIAPRGAPEVRFEGISTAHVPAEGFAIFIDNGSFTNNEHYEACTLREAIDRARGVVETPPHEDPPPDEPGSVGGI